jgi:hypothetical protein
MVTSKERTPILNLKQWISSFSCTQLPNAQLKRRIEFKIATKFLRVPLKSSLDDIYCDLRATLLWVDCCVGGQAKSTIFQSIVQVLNSFKMWWDSWEPYLAKEKDGLVQLELQDPRFDEVKRASVDLDQTASTLAQGDGGRSFLQKIIRHLTMTSTVLKVRQ